MTGRDEKFMRWAKLLYQDICDEFGNYFVISEDLNEKDKQAVLTLFAQRLYVVAAYATEETITEIQSIIGGTLREITTSKMMKSIHDFPGWFDFDEDNEGE